MEKIVSEKNTENMNELITIKRMGDSAYIILPKKAMEEWANRSSNGWEAKPKTLLKFVFNNDGSITVTKPEIK